MSILLLSPFPFLPPSDSPSLIRDSPYLHLHPDSSVLSAVHRKASSAIGRERKREGEDVLRRLRYRL